MLIGLSANSAIKAGENLHIYDWVGYDDPSYYPAYLKKFGKPDFTILSNMDDVLQKIKTGFKVDLVHPCSTDTMKWIQAGYIEPWDTSKIKNWNQFSPLWRDNMGFIQNGKVWIVPYDIYFTGLNVNTDLIDPKSVKSLDIFLDPKYKGKIAMPDEWSDAFSLVFLMQGVYDLSKVTPEVYNKALDLLRKIHQNTKFYWTIGDTDVIPPLSNKEIAFTWAWNSVSYTGGYSGGRLAFIRDVGFTGGGCGYAKMKGITPEKEALAYEYINTVTDQSMSVNFLEYTGFGHINEVGMKKQSKKSLEKASFDNLDKYKGKIFYWANVDTAFTAKAASDYEKIKAGF